ncbi:hypothetical protein C7212DRAFT_325334, partial [Tuber magnatum]
MRNQRVILVSIPSGVLTPVVPPACCSTRQAAYRTIAIRAHHFCRLALSPRRVFGYASPPYIRRSLPTPRGPATDR